MEPQRIEGAMAGEKFYDGAPCRHGHGTQRYVVSGMCVTCARNRTREQHRKARAYIKALREEGGND